MLHLIEIEKEKRRRYNKKNKAVNTLREHYQTHPLDYFKQRLSINPDTINWNGIAGYENHKWDGTINPLMEILDSLVNNNWVGIESATGTGKTFLGALIVFWFLDCFENSLVVTTAPKQEQLSLHIWKEIGKHFTLFDKGDLTQLKLKISGNKDERIAIGFVAGIKADEESSTKAQGFHAENMLIILEETPGIPLPLINALQNTCTAPHNLIVAFGNPDNCLDNLHQFCLQKQVKHIRISAYDHPNVVLDNPSFIPGACSLEGIRRIENRFGKEHPLTLSRTRGISPGQSPHSLIKLEWIKNAVQTLNDKCDSTGKFNEHKIAGVYALGVDAANSESGDKAAIALGIDKYLFEISEFQCNDSNRLGKVDVYSLISEKGIRPENVGVDGIGVGAGTVNALKELGQNIINIKGSESPVQFNSAEEFNNLRSQIWWQMREDLRLGEIGIINDPSLIADLIAPQWSTRNGNIIVESKDEIKKRLGRSPNKGDAAVYWNWIRKNRKQKTTVSAQIL